MRRKWDSGGQIWLGTDPRSSSVLNFGAYSVITVYLTPSESPGTTEKLVMENTHMDEQYLAAEIDNCELSATILKNYGFKIFLKTILSIVTFLRH